ncbi:hypothetical protein [uncultured Rossellomorea sp.]|uniref:hypothetical protein n=1 Tax=uncultured Rossellomorea sp. TaxID=2837549 RepID=UPI00261AADC5|nr:hypothetical protein [uncultured Rossellomorea sp.]
MPKEFYIILGTIIAGIVSLVVTFVTPVLSNRKDKKEFKRKHNYEQLKELYLHIYGIAIQSEYIRYFKRKYHGIDFNLREFPFLEIHMTKTVIKGGKATEEEITNAITEFNKQGIIDKILVKSEFASQRLLKLAVSYRYVHSNYQKESSFKKDFQEEELRLITLIIKTVIKECNELLDECNMQYDGKEISYGIMNLDLFNEYEE